VEPYRPTAPRKKLALRKQKLVKEWLLNANGWSEDRFGHLQKTTDDGRWKFRLKFGKQVVRLEKQWWESDKKVWHRVRSEYYGKLTEEQLLSWPNVV